MMYKQVTDHRNLLLVCVIALSFLSSLRAVVIGSNTVTSQQALASFPSTDTTNQMLGFGAFVNGFTLAGGGSCIFNSLYPVGGTVTLNGGTLSLSKDLIFLKGSTLYNGGVFTGNNRKITFLDTSALQLPTNVSNVNTVPYITQYNTGSSVLSCDWSYDASTVAVANNSSYTVGAYNFNGSTLTTAGSCASAATYFLCLAWHPTLNYVVTGRKQTMSINNVELWRYDSALKTFTLQDQEAQNKDITALAWHPSGNYLAVGTASGSQGIAIFSFANNVLTYLTEFDLSPSRSISANALSWDSTGTYLVAGTASSGASNGYEVVLYSFNGATLTQNAYLDPNILVNAVSYCPTGNYVAVGLATGTDRFQVYAHNPQAGTLTKVDTVSLGIASSVLSIDWSHDGKYVAFGTAAGTATELNVYSFDAAQQTMTLVASFQNTGAVNTLKWSPNSNYIAVGDSVNYLSVYGFTRNLVFNNVKLEVNADVTFNVPTIFKGVCAIEGNNHLLQCANQGALQVASGATLSLKNLTLNNITAATFYCADGTATINFTNVELALGQSDYNFNTGAFMVNGLLRIKGPYDFNYQTNQVSTINANGTLLIDQGSSFNYNPSISANNLVTFADATASLVVRSATIQVSNVGWQLTKGYIEFDGACYVISNGTQASQGLVLGDGVTPANNVTVRILPEAQCLISSGFIVDKSV